MTTAEFLASLRERDVRLWLEDGQLKCDAPAGALDEGWRTPADDLALHGHLARKAVGNPRWS